MQHLHLTHPQLHFRVTVEIHERDERFMATADLGEDSRSRAAMVAGRPSSPPATGDSLAVVY